MFFFVRHQYNTQPFVIRHSVRITEYTLYNGRKENWNIEERRREWDGWMVGRGGNENIDGE
jgi:hypothetical protein